MALTIAGSDSGGGAGIQADIKTFSALGVYGASVLTATTAQNTRAVIDIHDLPEAHILAQLKAVVDDLDVCAIKTGMLGRAVVVETVANGLTHFFEERLLSKQPQVPLIIDPVMVAKSGDMLLASEAVSAMLERLLPLAALITPNLPEALTLIAALDPEQSKLLEAQLTTAGSEAELVQSFEAIGQVLASAVGVPVLLKGGHLVEYAQGLGSATDLPVVDLPMIDTLTVEGRSRLFRSPRIATGNTHGTGCTLSAAIAARLALGDDLDQAVELARDYLHAAIAAADQLQIGSGHGPVHHFHAAPSWRDER